MLFLLFNKIAFQTEKLNKLFQCFKSKLKKFSKIHLVTLNFLNIFFYAHSYLLINLQSMLMLLKFKLLAI